MLRPYPLLDRAGRFSPFKAVVFVLLFVPGTWTAIAYATGQLGPRPFDEATHQIGTWALRFLFLSLAVTPWRELVQWPRLIAVRRMLGVAAFAYALAHLGLYVVHQAFDLVKVATEIALRIYLTIGFVAVLGLAALAATSTDAMIRRLGGPAWRRLHRASYVIALLALVHFFMQSKLNVYEPVVMAGIFGWLMLYRLWAASGGLPKGEPALVATALAVVTAALTAPGEALYYRLAVNAPFQRVLASNLDFDWDLGVRPAWVVLALGLAVALVAAVRSARYARRSLAPRAA